MSSASDHSLFQRIVVFRRDGGPRGDGGNRGYRESRDENFNRGGGRDRQWNDGGRDGDRPQRQNNDYQRGKR